MKRHVAGACVALVCASTACLQARAATPAADRAAVAQLEQHWLAAAHGGDRRALEDILAPNFLDINVNGQLRDRADHIAHVATPPDTTETIMQLNVRLFGDTAIATGINTVHSKTRGWTVDVAFTDVFVRSGGAWRAVSAQETLRKPAQATH